MMGKQLCAIFIFGLLFILATGEAIAASGWTDFGTISNLNQQSAGAANYVYVDVSVTSNPTDSGACTVRNGFYFVVDDDRKKRLFATLLAAQLSSRNVRIFVTGTCYSGYALLDGLILQ
ncbi:MAG TPA: hypothetical protein VIF82_16710 [Burkholderiaceae bacterium]